MPSLDRLYRSPRYKIENERNFLFEIVKHAWERGINLEGKEGLKRLVHLIQDPPFNFIGELPVPQYIDAEGRRSRLLNKVNTLISGPEVLWLEGQPLSMDLFLKCEEGKVPLNIINLSELEHFEERSFVVAQIAYTIYKWMRKLPGEETPRLLFLLMKLAVVEENKRYSPVSLMNVRQSGG